MKAFGLLLGVLACALLATLTLCTGDIGAADDAQDGWFAEESQRVSVFNTREGERVGLAAGDIAGMLENRTPAWTAEGNQEGAHFGYGLSGAGDVNGDGYLDVIIGAYAYDRGQTDEGRVFVYNGTGSGLASTPAWTAESNLAGGYMGSRVKCAGDVNDDGYSDVIVSVQYYKNDQDSEGAAFVFYGSSSGLSAAPDWIAEGNQENARLVAVDGAGDVNGDGYSDVVVGAPFYDVGTTDEGRAWVYYGGASGLASTPAWSADGYVEEAYFGYSVAGAGDVNGDGYSDIIVGARGPHCAYPVGSVYVFHGSASGLSSTPDWSAETDDPNAGFGGRVAGAGDVNGDGYSDVIIGASGYSNGHENEGAAYVYHGGPSGLAWAPAWIGEPNQDTAGYGSRVASAGDLNGDGYSDVIVGAFLYDNGQPDEGRAYVYYGSSTGLDTTPDWILEVNQAYAWLGVDVAGVGDVTGDGTPDVLVGASYFDSGEEDEGVAFLFDTPPEPPPSPEPTITSVIDHPQDEGKKVILSWAASSLDAPPDHEVTHYSVWRRYLGGGALQGLSDANPADLTTPARPNRSGINSLEAKGNGDFRSGLTEAAISLLTDHLANSGWEYVADSPARYLDEYAMTVPTYADSTESGIPYCGFIVMAHTENEWTFWVSEPDSGYSVDNRPPEPPTNLAGEFAGENRVWLHWNPNDEPDLAHYAVYRGMGADFIPSEETMVGTPTDTCHVDEPRELCGIGCFYKVSAFDEQGNESEHALLSPYEIVKKPGTGPSYQNVLYQNVPNPFSVSTRIVFSLERTAHVRLQIFDVSGRLVRVLVNEPREPRLYVEEWDGINENGSLVPSGVYLYRLETPAWTAVERMTLAR